MSQNTEKKNLAADAEKYLREHYTEKFSMDAVASALHVDKAYLARTFKRHTGTTLLAFHNRTRCEAAKDLLLHRPELSVSYIASVVGFISASHFSRIFKEYMGSTPTEYRKRAYSLNHSSSTAGTTL